MQPNCAALTIAGSDSGGGAGIQADLKTFAALGVFGTSAITAVTAQNLDGVSAIQALDPDIVAEQILQVLRGFPVRAMKTGMLFSAEIIRAVAQAAAGSPAIPLVIDPVFMATSGARLIEEQAVTTLTEVLFPRAALITPNIPEAEYLLQCPIADLPALQEAAGELHRRFAVPVLLKGGHLPDQAPDVLVDAAGLTVFPGPRVEGVNNHGSGCTLAAAIAALLARGRPLPSAVGEAKAYLFGALQHAYPLAPGRRVIHHFWNRCSSPAMEG